jgi:hypothetical protein
MCEHGVDQPGHFVRSGGDGFGCPQSRPLSPKISTQGTLGIEKCKSGHPQSSGCLIGKRFGRTTQDFSATDLSSGRQAEPRGKMFGRLPTAHVGTDLRNNLDGCGGVDAANTCQIDPRHALECFFHIARRGSLGIETLQLFQYLTVAVGYPSAHAEERQRKEY